MIIGITGGIASGKTTISNYIGTETPYKVVDADFIAKRLISTNEIEHSIKNAFPEAYTDAGQINRKILGDIIFYDNKRKEVLNSIMLPAIRKEMLIQINHLIDSGEKIVFVDSPLLIESGMFEYVDKIIVITCEKSERVKRIVKRNNWNEEKALMAINSQMPDETKMKYATHAIDTSSSDLNSVYELVRNLIKSFESEI